MISRVSEPEVLPGEAFADDGVVVLDGPDGVAIAMTPDCATGTADSLHRAANEAREQLATSQR